MRHLASDNPFEPASLLRFSLSALFAVCLACALSAAYSGCSVAYADGPAVGVAPTVQGSSARADYAGSTMATQSSGLMMEDVLLVDLDGATSWLSEDYLGKKYVAIAGSYDCSNTQNAVKQAYKLLDQGRYSDLDFLALDVDDVGDSFSVFSRYQTDRLRVFTGADYNSWAFDVWQSYSGSFDCVTLPFVFAVDENGYVLLAQTGPCDIVAFISEAYGIPAGGDDDETIVVAPNVATPTQEEIIARMDKDDVMLAVDDEFAIEPVFNTEMGKLSDETETLGLGMLNTVRFIAGLDDVVLDDYYGKMAQAAAFVNDAIDVMTHYPASAAPKPEGMSDEVWNLGCKGASQSNLGFNHLNLSTAIVYGWMSDRDCNNVSTVGHRRWCLNPDMAATGFGSTNVNQKLGCHYAMYSFDGSVYGWQSNVVWPAQNMPYELFNYGDPWSISVGSYISDPEAVTVTLTRKNDGKVWVFDELSDSSVSNYDECFYINNGNYGQTGCIIFRPAGISYKPGDEFHVEAANVSGTTVVYDVKFFEGFPGSYHPDDPYGSDDPDDPYGSDDLDDEEEISLYDATVSFPARFTDSYGEYVFASGKSAAPIVVVDGETLPKSAYSVEYTYIDPSTWNERSVGSAFPKKPGYYWCNVKGVSPYYGAAYAFFEVVKAANPLTAKAKSAKLTVKYSKLKKKAQTIAKSKAFVVEGAAGTVTFARKSGNKKISITSGGKVKVGKGLKKGKYTFKVYVMAAGDAYHESATKTVTLKIVVK